MEETLDDLKSLTHSERALWLDHLAESNSGLAERIRLFLDGYLVTKKELAWWCECEESTIEVWQVIGMPGAIAIQSETLFDIRDAFTWLAHRKSIKTSWDEGDKADRAYREHRAAIADLKRKKLDGELVDANSFHERMTTQVLDGIRTGLNNLSGNDVINGLSEVVDEAICDLAKLMGRQLPSDG